MVPKIKLHKHSNVNLAAFENGHKNYFICLWPNYCSDKEPIRDKKVGK